MLTRAFFFLWPAVMVMLVASCENNSDEESYVVLTPENPVERQDRLFGITISEGQESFETSFQHFRNAGAHIIELNIPWNEIEPEPGIYTDPYQGVLKNTAFYGQNEVEIILTLALIDAVDWEVPEYLSNTSCNSPQFLAAFRNMVDWVISAVPEDVTIRAISLGNEVDLVLQTAEDWEAYGKFMQATASYIHHTYPSIDIGVKTTVKGGVFSDDLGLIQSLNQFSDVVMLNYYPQNANYQVDEPESVYDHVSEIVAAFPGKRIWLTEVGYQSGSDLCGSSQTRQAHFYHHFFSAWDAYHEQIELVIINWMNDQSAETLEDWKAYYGNDPALLEFFSSLGLRTYEGSEKYAWRQLLKEVSVRGWTSQ